MTRNHLLRFTPPSLSSIAVSPTSGDITITFKPGSASSADLAEVLTVLSTFADGLRRAQANAESQVRAERVVSAFQQRCIEVGRSYQRLRISGVKHRAAVRSLFVDPAFFDLHGTLSDFGYWVKAYGLPSGSGVRTVGARHKAKPPTRSKS